MINLREDLYEGLSTGKIAVPYIFMEIIRFSKEKRLDILTVDSYRELVKKGSTESEILFIVKMRAFSKKYYSQVQKIIDNTNLISDKRDKGDSL